MPRTLEIADVDVLNFYQALPEDDQNRLLEIRKFLATEISPHLAGYWSRDEFPYDLAKKIADLGYSHFDGMSSNPLMRKYLMAELARCDISLSVYFALSNELVGATFELLASEEQQAQWLPGIRSMETIGCFALTEPEHGSDVAQGTTTTARLDGDEWVLNGAKRWIGNGTIAHVAIVWARDEADGQVKGFIVETDREGFEATKIEYKTAVRIVQNADITLTDVRIPRANKLAKADSFQATGAVLQRSRNGLAWQAVGAQMGIFDIARSYALQRNQFGRPIAKFQLMQSLLVQIAGNLAASLGMAHRAAELEVRGEVDMTQAALVKLTTSQFCRESAALGRQLMGGNGTLADYGMGRFFSDAEAIFTYEGSYEINTLLAGRGITGMSAFI